MQRTHKKKHGNVCRRTHRRQGGATCNTPEEIVKFREKIM